MRSQNEGEGVGPYRPGKYRNQRKRKEIGLSLLHARVRMHKIGSYLRYYHDPTHTFNPFNVTSNEFSIPAYVYVDIKMLYSKICQYDCQHAFNLMGHVFYFPLYLLPEGHLFFKWALSTEARSTTK